MCKDKKTRRLIVQQYVSLDGFAAGKSDDIEFISRFGWDDQLNKAALNAAKSIGTVLLGRKTYQMFIEYWPTQTTDTEPMADTVNNLPKSCTPAP